MSSLTATTAMTNVTDLASRLLKVGLLAIGRSLDDFLARVTRSRLSPVQILEEIARLEEIDKGRRSQESRLRRARIGRFKAIADFDWNWPKKIERDLIERALKQTQGNVTHAARLLKISRKGLQLKMKELGLRERDDRLEPG